MILAWLFVGLLANPALATAWYTGGTLHRADLATWSSASDRNQLATAADWTTSMMNGKKDWRSMQEVKAWARKLQACVDKVAADKSLGSQSASEMAATCAILLGWR